LQLSQHVSFEHKLYSENVMHESEQSTDVVYSNFQESELKNQIASLGRNGGNEIGLSNGDLDKIAQLVAEKLKK
jgi:3-methyladenine DNA glycosylase AlkD